MLWHFVVVKKKTWKESFGKSKRRCHSSVFNMRPHTSDSRTPLPTSSSLSYTPSHIFLVIHPPHIMGKSLGIQKEKTKKGDIYWHLTRIWREKNLNCSSLFSWTAHPDFSEPPILSRKRQADFPVSPLGAISPPTSAAQQKVSFRLGGKALT